MGLNNSGSGGAGVSENTPVYQAKLGIGLSSVDGAKYGGSAGGGAGNIFGAAGDSSNAANGGSAGGHVQAFTAHVTGSSPAFGQPEHSYSRDH